eukprot:gene10909-2983_t
MASMGSVKWCHFFAMLEIRSDEEERKPASTSLSTLVAVEWLTPLNLLKCKNRELKLGQSRVKSVVCLSERQPNWSGWEQEEMLACNIAHLLRVDAWTCSTHSSHTDTQTCSTHSSQKLRRAETKARGIQHAARTTHMHGGWGTKWWRCGGWDGGVLHAVGGVVAATQLAAHKKPANGMHSYATGFQHKFRMRQLLTRMCTLPSIHSCHPSSTTFPDKSLSLILRSDRDLSSIEALASYDLTITK